MTFEHHGKSVEQLSEMLDESDYYCYLAHYYICDGRRFETQHDLECYLDPTYLETMLARKMSERKKLSK